MKDQINSTHTAFQGVKNGLHRRKRWAVIVFSVAVLAMLGVSTGVAMMSGNVFMTILEDPVLAMTIAILQHVGLAIGVDLLTRGYQRHDPLLRIAGWVITVTCLVGILFITVGRALIRMQEGMDPFKAWVYSILFGLIETILPAAFGFLTAEANWNYNKVRWMSYKTNQAGHSVLADHLNPVATWKATVDEWTATAAELKEEASQASGEEYDRLMIRVSNWKDLVREHQPALARLQRGQSSWSDTLAGH